jgi:hypothetical protein
MHRMLENLDEQFCGQFADWHYHQPESREDAPFSLAHGSQLVYLCRQPLDIGLRRSDETFDLIFDTGEARRTKRQRDG